MQTADDHHTVRVESLAARRFKRTSFRRAAAVAAILAIAAITALVTWGVITTRGGGAKRGSVISGEILVANAKLGSGVVLGVSYEPRTQVSVIDAASGVVRGTIATGYTPWVSTRASHHELLVSQAFGPGPGENDPTLRIYDLNDITRTPRVIAMPGRSSQIPVTYTPSMALSADENLLYYETRSSQCPDGGDAALCDVPGIAVIDLDAGTQVGQASLSVGCSPALIRPIGASDVLAMCEQSSGSGHSLITRASPSGSAQVAEFPLRIVDGNQQRVDGFGVTADGAYYVAYRDGGVAVSDGRVVADLIPAGARLGLDTGSRIGAAGTLFAYGAGSGGAYDSLLIFRTDDPASSRQIKLPFSVSDVAAIDEHRVALLPATDDHQTPSMRLVVFDLVSEAIVGTETALPASAQWLVGD